MNDSLEFQKQIQIFFSHFGYNESKESLWLWLRTTVTGNFSRLSGTQRENLLSFYDETARLIDTSWLLNQQLTEPQHSAASSEKGTFDD